MKMKHPFYTLSDLKMMLIPAFLFLMNVQLMHAQSANLFTINQSNVSVKEVLTQLEKSSKFVFLYADKDVDVSRKVTVKATKQTLNVVLDQLFHNTNNSYTIDGSQVFITRKVVQSTPGKVQKKSQITGYVLDEKKVSIIGASVMLLGTSQGTVTDFDGKFTLEVPENSQLKISFVGYEPQLINVGDKANLTIVMRESENKLEEIIISAQAIGQKNAILQQINSNTIKNVVAADRLQENPDANSVEALGRLPGISVQRSGGEGVGLVIRGLEPRYTSVTLNGVQLPSTSGSDRGTNLSGISQYALQGAEVFKSLTADMDANSVAGTVNLKLREAPKDFHANLMVQKGYNDLNNYWGNYKLLGEFSNRFFENKLGVLFIGSAEKVNRSIQTMSAGYDIVSADRLNGDILLGAIGLNNNTTIIYRRSAMLSLDYKLSDNTTLMLYGMYNNSKNDSQSQVKSYGVGGAGSVGYSFSVNPNAQANIFQTALSGETKFKFLKLKAEYGLSFSNGKNDNTGARSWNFQFDNASDYSHNTTEYQKMDPAALVPLYKDNADRLTDCRMTSFGVGESKIDDENINAFLNLTIPFKIGDFVSGNFKFGGLYRTKSRLRDDVSGSQYAMAGINQFLPQILADSLDWIVRSANNDVTANGLTDGRINNFLGGQFNFGNTFNLDRLNQISDLWERRSEYYSAQGPEVYLPLFGDISKLGYQQNVAGSMMNDQDIKDSYWAGYFMSEINFGKYVMFLPGVRFEDTHTTMKGFYAIPLQYPPRLGSPLPGSDTSAVRSDRFILPMIHLRVKPTESFYIHCAYTQTLSRPDFNVISPNYYVNTGVAPFSYSSTNPTIRPELWTNLDAQFVFHGKKIGLFSVNVFYKTVEDKIWSRGYQRIKGDAIIDPFPNTAVVNVNTWENHSYTGYVRGVEVDWQTSFHFLPKPFNYLTLSANYTFTKSKTNYPYTRIDLVTPPGGGRPVPLRVDSAISGPMYNQPDHIANVSLGFNKDGFNAWLSFQYNGGIYTSKNFRATPRLDTLKDSFYRWDLQLTQKFAIKNRSGFEVLLNIANISNFTETQHVAGDIRPTYQEQYGWTADMGLRFKF